MREGYAREFWRQSEESAAQPATTNALITVEAHHAEGRADVGDAQSDLLALLKQYAGGTFRSSRA